MIRPPHRDDLWLVWLLAIGVAGWLLVGLHLVGVL